VAFLPKQDVKLFLVNSAWRTGHRFIKFSIDLCLKSRESIVGEIEQRFFRQRLCADDNFFALKVEK